MPIAPILPLDTDPVYGVASYDLETGNAEQNLINLLLTIPGERVDVKYGVGLSTYLFSQSTKETLQRLKASILSQAARYMPEISISDVEITEMSSNENGINVKITFTIFDSAETTVEVTTTT